MKILMLNPPFLPKYSRFSRSPAVTKSGTIYFPIWHAYATGLLEQHGHQVRLVDAPAEGLEREDCYKITKEFSPDMVVVYTSTPSIFNDVEIAGHIKDLRPASFIVLAGPHVSALPEESLNMDGRIDAVARREYDMTLVELASILPNRDELEKVKGLTFRKKKKIITNPDRDFIQNLDSLPFVSAVYKRHLNIKNYFYAHTRNPVVSFFAGRGCPNRCFFCVYPQVMFGHKYRHRSPENIVEELEYIKNELSEVKEVLIDDDNFTVDQEHVLNICDLIIQKKLKITWTVETRVDLKYDVMVKMKKAGCRLFVPGFESGEQRILDNINKRTTINQSSEFCKNAKKAGVRIHGCFMVGNKGETKETMKKTLEFAKKLNLDTVQFFPLMIYPGTKAYSWAQENSYICADSYRNWLTGEGLHNCVINTDKLSAKELVEFCDKARREFYLRPTYIIRKILDLIINPSEIMRTIKAARVLSKYIFRRKKLC